MQSTYYYQAIEAICIATLEEAIEKHGQPEIFNTAHGS
jgi:hypothetical protein